MSISIPLRTHTNQSIQPPTPNSTYPNHDATYLLWVDTAGLAPYLPKGGDPASFFIEHAKVAVSDGRDFGAHHHVRINFGALYGEWDRDELGGINWSGH